MGAAARILDRRRISAVLTHVIFILILCVLPEVLMRMSWPTPRGIPWWVYAKSGVMLAVFYINYFLIIPHTLTGHQRWWRFAGCNLVLILAGTAVMYLLSKYGHPHGGRGPRGNPDEWQRMVASASFMLRDALMLILTTSLAVAIRLTGTWRDLERRRAALLALRRESELEGLRSQLNPHFLFNTLNSIYALIAISPPEAQEAVHRLSQLLRRMVYDNPERVTVGSEVELLHHYIALMRLRLGSRPVEFRAYIEHPERTVAPLLFMTLVENAFKYGATAPAGQPIKITLTESADTLQCTTFNHYNPAAAEHREGAAAKPGGVGLANLRRRLELLYGDKASLTIETGADTFRACVTITLK